MPRLQPTAELQKFWGQFGIKIYAGFHMPVYSGETVKFDEDKNSYLTGGNNDPIVADWTALLVLTG